MAADKKLSAKEKIGNEVKFVNELFKFGGYLIFGISILCAYLGISNYSDKMQNILNHSIRQDAESNLQSNPVPTPRPPSGSNRRQYVIDSPGVLLHQDADFQYSHDVDTPAAFRMDHQRYRFRFSQTATTEELRRAIQDVSQHPFIVVFDFTDCINMNDDLLREVAVQTTGLLDIKVPNCRQVTDVGLSYLAKMGTLRIVNIGENNNITTVGLKKLVRGNPGMTAVEINGDPVNIRSMRN